jgi:hypothetical protein
MLILGDRCGIVNSWVPRSGRFAWLSHLATGPYAVTFGHLEACTDARQTSRAVRLHETQRSIAAMPASSSEYAPTFSQTRLIRGESWRKPPVRASPAPVGQHDDRNTKADGFEEADGRSLAQSQHSWHGLAARCFRPVPRENCSESQIGSSRNHVLYVTGAFPLRIVHRCRSRLKTSRLLGTRSSIYGGVILDQASIPRYLAMMHRHTCITLVKTRVTSGCSPYFPSSCCMQASDKYSA